MTKLLKTLKAKFTGRRVPKLENIEIKHEINNIPINIPRNDCVYEYRTSVTVGCSYFISEQDHLRGHGEIVSENILRAISREIYGEIQDQLNDMYSDLHAIKIFLPMEDAIKFEEKFNKLVSLVNPNPFYYEDE